jgi:hypothetical protein
MTNYQWLIAHKDIQQEECLIWPFSQYQNGYGCVGIPKTKKTTTAHRIMCELKYGLPPENKINALHKCNNIYCVNPNHLYWGSKRDNAIDSRNIGMQPNQKLNEQDVLEIRLSSLSHKELANQYNVSISYIGHLRSGHNWKDIK